MTHDRSAPKPSLSAGLSAIQQAKSFHQPANLAFLLYPSCAVFQYWTYKLAFTQNSGLYMQETLAVHLLSEVT